MFLQYEEEMLLEDVNFPLKVVGDRLYDKADNLIADKLDDDISDRLTGKFIEVEDIEARFELNKSGMFVDIKTGLSVGNIRGWSRLQHKPEPRKRKDNIAHYLVNRLNAR